MLFFVSMRDGEGLGQEEWGGGDSLEGTPQGPGDQSLCHLEQVLTPLEGSVLSSLKWADRLQWFPPPPPSVGEIE